MVELIPLYPKAAERALEWKTKRMGVEMEHT